MGSSPKTTQPQDGETTQEYLFQLAMNQKWSEVADVYADDRLSWPPHTAKLTNAEETALHVAVSSYRSDHRANKVHYSDIECMIKSIPADDLTKTLLMQNDRGNTVLHLATSVGWQDLCRLIASKDRLLMEARNHRRETPLFMAALYGNLKTFACLHKIHMHSVTDQQQSITDQQRYYELCRRDDGNTILHVAIAEEHFDLAYQIMKLYPKLINSVNEAGESPLYVLAMKPNVFKSSTNLGLSDSVIYYCMIVEDLKYRCFLEEGNDSNSRGRAKNYPENYQTCVNILYFLWRPIIKSFKARSGKSSGNRTDVENQQTSQKKSEGTCSHDEGEDYDRCYPPNYTTFVLLIKFGLKVILTVLGVGFNRIKKIREKKQRHVHAFKIMNQLIEYESSYKYKNDGQEPIKENKPQLPEIEFDLPGSPPSTDDSNGESSTTLSSASSDQGHHANEDQQKDHNNKPTNGDQNEWPMVVKHDASSLIIATKTGNPEMVKKILETLPIAMLDINNKQSKHVKKDTSLLIAAKMGIPEMVEKILRTFPIAIQDVDSNGKSVLLLAAENRQTSVFNYLLSLKLPECVFHQVHNNGNSLLDLADMLGELHPWRIPGAALQMQWEIKWYKYVKRNIPRVSCAHRNNEGETARKIFTKTHEPLVEKGTSWLIKTSESCSVVAALIATVSFSTSATVPGGLNQNSGHPIMEKFTAFDVFSLSALIALCLSVTALVFFLAIITSRCQERDFKSNLPKKLLMGLTALFASIIAILVSFCAGHTFVLRPDIRIAAMPIYAIACVPVSLFALAQLPLYFDLLLANYVEVPLRSYKVYHD